MSIFREIIETLEPIMKKPAIRKSALEGRLDDIGNAYVNAGNA